MTLNEKCMKDILQYCANDVHVMMSGATITRCKLLDLPKEFPEYTTEEILYSLVKLIELNYLTITPQNELWDEHTKVKDVTYYGHKYINNCI